MPTLPQDESTQLSAHETWILGLRGSSDGSVNTSDPTRVPPLKPGQAGTASDGGSLNAARNHVWVFISVLLTGGGLDLIKHKHTDGVSIFHFPHVCAIVSSSEFFFFSFFCFSTPLRILIHATEAGTGNCRHTCLKIESEHKI